MRWAGCRCARLPSARATLERVLPYCLFTSTTKYGQRWYSSRRMTILPYSVLRVSQTSFVLDFVDSLSSHKTNVLGSLNAPSILDNALDRIAGKMSMSKQDTDCFFFCNTHFQPSVTRIFFGARNSRLNRKHRQIDIPARPSFSKFLLYVPNRFLRRSLTTPVLDPSTLRDLGFANVRTFVTDNQRRPGA